MGHAQPKFVNQESVAKKCRLIGTAKRGALPSLRRGHRLHLLAAAAAPEFCSNGDELSDMAGSA